MPKPFHFKEFSVNQDRCAMKIGTDGVLLGAWASLKKQPEAILDIGAGTGVIAMMMAQRSPAELIDAVEMDPDAYEQCVENFEASPWSDRLFCYHASFSEFVEEMDERYDLIVSNPPFHSEQVFSPEKSRDQARSLSSLPLHTLFQQIPQLLSEKGSFNLIVPFDLEKETLAAAKKNKLYPNRLTRVKGTPSTDVKRSLLEFSKTAQEFAPQELIIEKERHDYTEAYKKLTADFYLNM